jgi:predicted nucleic acid-binding protein
MYLVDTSVWVSYINGYDTPAVELLDALLLMPMAVGITDLIYMEILQGAKSEAAYKKLQKYFSTQKFYRFTDPRSSYEKAALIYLSCRRRGITVRSSIDCLIAQCALENKLILLHHDNDYRNLEKVIPGLRQKHFLS